MEKIKLKYWNSTLKIFYTVAVIVLSFSSNSYADNTSIPTTPSSFIIDDEKAHEIVLNGTPDDVKKLIQSGYDVNKVYLCNSLLITAIKSAARGSYAHVHPEYALEKIKILINAKADTNAYNCPEKSMRPLAWAVTLPNQMLSAGDYIEKNIEDKIKVGKEYCDFPGFVSKPCKDVSFEEKVKIKKSIKESFQIATKLSMPYFMNIIEFLINNGADVNGTDVQNQSILHHAVINPQNITVEPVKFLIKKGANVNAKDIYGHTPLFLAYGLNNTDVVNILINAGADVNVRTADGSTYKDVKAQIKIK